MDEMNVYEKFLKYITEERLRQIGVDAEVVIKRKEPENEHI